MQLMDFNISININETECHLEESHLADIEDKGQIWLELCLSGKHSKSYSAGLIMLPFRQHISSEF